VRGEERVSMGIISAFHIERQTGVGWAGSVGTFTKLFIPYLNINPPSPSPVPHSMQITINITSVVLA
jgi:hypothetical protein